MIDLCPPAMIYLIFSAIQIIIDTFKGLYNTVLIKIIVATMVTLLLNILCSQGLNVVSWIIVFIPFILMTVIVSMILYVFGLNATTGNLNYACDDYNKCPQNITVDESGNIIIYDPTYNQLNRPVIFKSPNLIVPNPNIIIPTPNTNSQIKTFVMPNFSSSSPIYQS
jgi:hypothetical protein